MPSLGDVNQFPLKPLEIIKRLTPTILGGFGSDWPHILETEAGPGSDKLVSISATSMVDQKFGISPRRVPAAESEFFQHLVSSSTASVFFKIEAF